VECAGTEIGHHLLFLEKGDLIGIGDARHIGELAAHDRGHVHGAAGHVGEVPRQHHRAIADRDLKIADYGFGPVHPDVADGACDLAIGADHVHATGVRLAIGDDEVGGHAKRADDGFAVGTDIRLVLPLGPTAGADTGQQRVARRLQRSARMRRDRFGVQRAGLTLVVWYRDGAAVGERKGLWLRHEDRAQGLDLAGDVVLQRIALAAILTAQIEDQAEEEDPEQVQDDLRDVDVSGDASDIHGHGPPSLRVHPPGHSPGELGEPESFFLRIAPLTAMADQRPDGRKGCEQ
jgi:hypothetical protein